MKNAAKISKSSLIMTRMHCTDDKFCRISIVARHPVPPRDAFAHMEMGVFGVGFWGKKILVLASHPLRRQNDRKLSRIKTFYSTIDMTLRRERIPGLSDESSRTPFFLAAGLMGRRVRRRVASEREREAVD
jgi:hypothetical protein